MERPRAPHRWHAEDIPDEDRARFVFDYVKAIEERQSEVRLQMFKNAYLYTGEELTGINVDWERRSSGQPDLPRINVVGSVIETAYSRITAREPRLAVKTRGGDWELRRRAKGLESFLEGTLRDIHFAREWGKAFRDGASLGLGLVKEYRYGDKITCDRVFPLEVVVDETASRTTAPMAMFQRRFPDVDELCAEWPEHEDEIWAASRSTDELWTSYITHAPYTVPVIEAWRKPGPYTPGMHFTCIQGHILGEIEEWQRPTFPFAEVRWMEKLTGWYGIGIPEIVYFLQARVNRHAAYEAACQNRAVSPVILVDQTDAQLEESLTNDLGQVVPFAGRFPPSFVAPPQVPPEIYRDEERKIKQIYDISGMSEFATGARSRPPTGLDSKPALSEWIDYTEGRFLRQEKQYDEGFVTAGYIAIELAKELAADKKIAKTTWDAPRYGLVDVEWSKVDMDRDKFRLSLQPAASSSQQPAMLRQRLEEERASGRLADDLYRYFVQTLDVEAYYNLYDAATNDLMRTIAHLEDEELEFPSPSEYQALDLGLWMVQMEWNRIHALGAPPSILRRLETWLEQAEHLKQLGAGAQVAGAPQLGPAQAGGGPQAPQLADLGNLPVAGMA